MKIYAILAVLILGVPASVFADRRVVVVSRGYGGGYYRPSCSYAHGYGYAGVRRAGWYSPFPFFRAVPRYYAPLPAVHFSYSSVSPRYVGRSTGNYDSNSIEIDVQRALRSRGYYRGALDGDIGPASRSAIRAYQADHGLEANGLIDSALLRSLGI